MTLDTDEFIRGFLMHVLPQGFDRIRYYRLLTSPTRANNRPYPRLARAAAYPDRRHQGRYHKARRAETERPSPCCGSRMRIIETFLPGQQPKHCPTHFRRRAGSTPHDDNLRAIAPKSRSLVCSLLRRPRLRSLRYLL
jgi:hypothetical protein